MSRIGEKKQRILELEEENYELQAINDANKIRIKHLNRQMRNHSTGRDILNSITMYVEKRLEEKARWAEEFDKAIADYKLSDNAEEHN